MRVDFFSSFMNFLGKPVAGGIGFSSLLTAAAGAAIANDAAGADHEQARLDPDQDQQDFQPLSRPHSPTERHFPQPFFLLLFRAFCRLLLFNCTVSHFSSS